MKIIHTADIHLGSKLSSHAVGQKRRDLKQDIRTTFSNMVDYAKNNGVSAIILAGDVFDDSLPKSKDKDYFYSVIKNNPEIDFLYLRGNHDDEEDADQNYNNLKRFTSSFTSYNYDSVCISGVEITSENYSSFYSQIDLDPNKTNVLVLHGDVSDSIGINKVCLKKLKNKNVNYLALGHYHTYKIDTLDDTGVYAYSGCLEGRGFDETGEKGFIMLDVNNKAIVPTFIPFSSKVIVSASVDVSGLTTVYEVASRIKKVVEPSPKTIVKVVLNGTLDFDAEDIETELERELYGFYSVISIKNQTHVNYNVEKFISDNSLKGEYVRTVLASSLPEEEKQKVIALGLKALDGEEIE